jgi:hypothetical protein
MLSRPRRDGGPGGGFNAPMAPPPEREVQMQAEDSAGAPASRASMNEEKGRAAIDVSERLAKMKSAGSRDEAEATGVAGAGSGIRKAGAKTFLLTGGKWRDTALDDPAAAKAPALRIKFGSDAYFQLLGAFPELARYAALGKSVTVWYRGTVVELDESAGETTVDLEKVKKDWAK